MFEFLLPSRAVRCAHRVAIAVAKEYAKLVKSGMIEAEAQRQALNTVFPDPLPIGEGPGAQGPRAGDVFKADSIPLAVAILFALRMQGRLSLEQFQDLQKSRSYHALVSTFMS